MKRDIVSFQASNLLSLQTASTSKGNQQKWYDEKTDCYIKAQFYYQDKYWRDEYKCRVSDLTATELFMDDRVVPDTRQGLASELKNAGIKYYDPEALIRYNKGVSIEDSYWVDVE